MTNTDDNIIVDMDTGLHYVLISGRWFAAQSMETGPWQYVPNDKLPAAFAQIPVTHPRGVVLPSVTGTPPAQEAVIDNSIPETATVNRATTTLTIKYSSTPQIKPIEGTTLEYVVNSPYPVIKVDAYTWYSLKDAVWFVGSSVNGPWSVAAFVPEIIYTIPPSSSLHYVTYVYVFGSTPQTVTVGYTPGYYGTVLAPTGVVVYGTGYVYPPIYVGAVWYPPPVTYGFGAGFFWGSVTGFAFGAAAGAIWGGAWGHYGGYASYTSVHINNFNSYNHWSSTQVHTNVQNDYNKMTRSSASRPSGTTTSGPASSPHSSAATSRTARRRGRTTCTPARTATPTSAAPTGAGSNTAAAAGTNPTSAVEVNRHPASTGSSRRAAMATGPTACTTLRAASAAATPAWAAWADGMAAPTASTASEAAAVCSAAMDCSVAGAAAASVAAIVSVAAVWRRGIRWWAVRRVQEVRCGGCPPRSSFRTALLRPPSLMVRAKRECARSRICIQRTWRRWI